MEQHHRTALITGSGRNMGRGCALELARAGFNIIVNGSSKRDACERVAEEVRAIGPKAIVAMGNVGDQQDVQAIVEQSLSAFGTVDALINNAAVRPPIPFLEMTDDDLTRVMNVNVNAAVRLARAFLPGMIDKGWGRVVNFSGMNAQRGTGTKPAVTMSKHASWGLTKSLAREFGPKGITANIISPGTFPDEDVDINTSEQFQTLLKQTPVGRLGTSQDIAALVGLLCSEHGGFINGQLLQVNGGVEC